MSIALLTRSCVAAALQVFTHYAYALPSQVEFKDAFYGYGGKLLQEVLSSIRLSF